MRFGKLDINPAESPAVLDTATWDPASARQALAKLGRDYLSSLQEAALQGKPLPHVQRFTPHTPSQVRWRDSLFFLGELADGQCALLELGDGQGQTVLGTPVVTLPIPGGGQAAAYKADLTTIARFVQEIHPSRAPKALGDLPRLGVGNRMTTATWPAIYRAMGEGSFAANAIQNSMRELNLLDDLLAGRPPEQNYGPNLGRVEAGHTGSTFEGLWLYGVLEALKVPGEFSYGADADHMQVKGGPEQLQRTKRALDSARHYTFFTIDVSDILHYGRMGASPAAAEDLLKVHIPDPLERQGVLAYHRQPGKPEEIAIETDDAAIGRLVGKYWDGFDALEALTAHVRQLKHGEPFDLEFAIDEVPAGVRACESVTADTELLFVIREARRRDIPLTHVACNFGIEKEMDYRCPDGLPGLERRVRRQARMAEAWGVMLDFHSGDDLAPATRRVIGRATNGRVHFKISPSLQVMFAETLSQVHPKAFGAWWEGTLAYARREAADGSPLATECLREYEAHGDPQPGAHHRVFHHYGFAYVGQRDGAGQFMHRESLYGLSGEFYATYQERVARFLRQLAEELFQRDN